MAEHATQTAARQNPQNAVSAQPSYAAAARQKLHPDNALDECQKVFGNQAMQRSLLAGQPGIPGLQRKCASCRREADDELPNVIQTKLVVNQPGDVYEQEADRVAEAVISGSSELPNKHFSQESAPAQVQRACSCGGTCDECQGKTEMVQRTGSNSAGSLATAPSIVHRALQSSSRPLDITTRAFMESRLGRDFSGVRVHTDATAAQSALAVNALVYTVKRDIVFGQGQFTPTSDAGRRILAHELVHVVQQGEASGPVRVPDASHSTPIIQRIPAGGQAPALQRAFSCNSFNYPGRTTALSTVPGRICVDYQGISGIIASPPFSFQHFSESGSALTAAHVAQITTLQSSLLPTDTVQIHGYASCDGAPEFNLNLSCSRAEAAGTALASSGAKPFTGTIKTFAHGETSEFGASLDDNRRAILLVAFAPPPPVPKPPPPSCPPSPNRDEWGPAFNPTTSGEKWVGVQHPIDDFKAFDCRDDAFAAARASGLPGPYLGPQDAFRHCFASCCLAEKVGAAEAEEFGTAHENSNSSSIPFDNDQDLHDNSIGRGLAGPSVDCDTACKTALTAGFLRTIRGPSVSRATKLSSPVATDCIGPSNQPWP
jgi:hypothetical protein